MLFITIPFYPRHGHFIHIPGKHEMAYNVDHRQAALLCVVWCEFVFVIQTCLYRRLEPAWL